MVLQCTQERKLYTLYKEGKFCKMACTTILVGKNASYDGSTMIARNDDSGSGHLTAKKWR